MKQITAVIKPFKLEEVREGLAECGVTGLTVTEVRGHGKQKGHTAVYRGKEYNVSLLPKMEIEVVVPDALADDAIKAIVAAARTGEIDDPERVALVVRQPLPYVYVGREILQSAGIPCQMFDALPRTLRLLLIAQLS